jgi:hypothetical protein
MEEVFPAKELQPFVNCKAKGETIVSDYIINRLEILFRNEI